MQQSKESLESKEKVNISDSKGYNGPDVTSSNEIPFLLSFQYDLPSNGIFAGTGESEKYQWSIVRVCQLLQIDNDEEISEDNSYNKGEGKEHDQSEFAISDDEDERKDGSIPSADIWALIEYKITSLESDLVPPQRFKRWRKFQSESSLSDHIRRETGEPIILPSYSLSPVQSSQLQEEARQAVSHITEEFRRYRVRSEVARKQADATVKALHNNNVKTTQERIEGQDLESELLQARTEHQQLATLRAEITEQEAHWKQAYDVLLAENTALKSSGAEALLAAQWRQRYESSIREKEDLQTNLKMEKEKLEGMIESNRKVDAGKFEAKYRDLKESFRLYRKKAKEIFDAQQRGDVAMLTLSDNQMEDAKISYLRNLMVNYLSSDTAVRDHMEGAIGTVLKFSREDFAKIKQQKAQNESWLF